MTKITELVLLISIYTIVVANNDLNQHHHSPTLFSLNLLKVATDVSNSTHLQNQILSPINIAILLSMLQEGANGRTLNQLEALQGSIGSQRSRFKTFFDKQSEDLLIGNKIFLNPNYENHINEDYKTSLQQFYGALIDCNLSVNTINEWAASVTGGHIRNIVTEGNIHPHTTMVLLSTIYFKGLWGTPFVTMQNPCKNFKTSSKTHIRVPFMTVEGEFISGRSSTLGLKWVRIPYKNQRFSMLLILPTKSNRHESIAEIINRLTLRPQAFERIIKWDKLGHAIISMPKFKGHAKISMKTILDKMGLSDLFGSEANLTGMLLSEMKREAPLSVSEIMQETAIEVDDKGSEVSVASVAVIETLCHSQYSDELHFHVNQPFIFAIIDTVQNLPLVIANIANPDSFTNECKTN